MIIASFLGFLLLFVVIGVSSVAFSKKTTADYLLAGHSVPPWLVALSAVATNNSGYMFTGMIGYTYLTGLSSCWLMIGWISGDYFASLFVHKKLRLATTEHDVYSFSGLLSSWNQTYYPKLRAITGILTLVFLGTYAAAQLSAGSKALTVLFGWHHVVGSAIGAAIVLAYCVAGGIRASIWTDAAQSFVMFAAMILLAVVGINSVGGVDAAINQLIAVSPGYFSLTPQETSITGGWSMLLFVLGWFAAGICVVGQPHIMVRFMTLDNPNQFNKVRIYYYGWFIAFYALTITVGLLSRLLLNKVDGFDEELALILLAQELFPPTLIGLVLAGLFAATISTADSLVLSCSAALTRDFKWNSSRSYLATKFGTVFICIFAFLISVYGDRSVFQLVILSWAILGAAFGPLLFVYTLGKKPSERLAIAMVVIGSSVVIIWREMGLGSTIYEAAPGLIAGFLTYCIGRLLSNNQKCAI